MTPTKQPYPTMHGIQRVRSQVQDARSACLPALALLVVVLLEGCGSGPSTTGGAKPAASSASTPSSKVAYAGGRPGWPYPFAQVVFTPATSYATALRLVTGLGLQPANPCTYGVSTYAWMAQDGKDAYTSQIRSGYPPTITVLATGRSGPSNDVSLYFTAPTNWPDRVGQQASVVAVDDKPIHGCPPYPNDSTPASERITYLDASAQPTYAHITFAADTTYDQALIAASALGFRLADPCYEQAQPKPAWHSMGQETSYATSTSLTVATTGASATAWLQQLAGMPGVAALVAPYTAAC